MNLNKDWIEMYKMTKELPPEQRENIFKLTWLKTHVDADSISFDIESGVPHQAIYTYPLSTIAQEEWLQSFFETVREEMEKERLISLPQ